MGSPPGTSLPELAGYHVYWTLDLSSIGGINRGGMSGPLTHEDGSTFVWPPGADLRGLPMKLPPARFLLIPVDAQGRELAHLDVIEEVIMDRSEAHAYEALISDGTRELGERAANDPSLASTMAELAADPDRKALFIEAVERASKGVFGVATSPTELHGTAREAVVQALADRAVDVVREVQKPTTSSVQLDRTGIETLLRSPLRCSITQIWEAVARADYEDAAARALARLKLRQSLPPGLVANILPGLLRRDVFLALVHFATGDMTEPLRKLLAERRFAETRAGCEQMTIALYALWRLGPEAAARPFILPFARRLVRGPMDPPSRGLLAWLVHELADSHVIALMQAFGTDVDRSQRDGWAFISDEAYVASIDEVIAGLPERKPPLPLPGVAARAVVKPGRNDLCPCGSGKKFKRCHADRPDEVISRGPSRLEQLAEVAPRLQPEHVDELTRADLAALDLDRLREHTLITVLRKQLMVRDWPRAHAAAVALGRRPGVNGDEWLDEVVHGMLDARRFELTRKLLPGLEHADSRADAELTLALALDEPDALSRLRARARPAVADASGGAAIDLAHVLLRAEPALGILFARGALSPDRALDAEVLLRCIEEARDDLGLPPWDPAQEVFFQLVGDDDDARRPSVAAEPHANEGELARKAERLQAQIDEATSRLATLQQEAVERERELRRAEQAVASTAQRSEASAEEKRRWRDKVEELKSLITAGNAERAELRRQLTEATVAVGRPEEEQPARRRQIVEEDEDVVAVAAPAGGRRPHVPRFSERATGAMEQIDQTVVAMAFRHVGTLAAGDVAAWRGVKQAKDMPRQVLMARIGIHHRLLFRCEDGTLEVIDLVTRENLMTTLKHLRSV